MFVVTNRFRRCRRFRKRDTWGLRKRGPPAPPKYTLPSGSFPLTDKCLKNAWKESRLLKFMPVDRYFVCLIAICTMSANDDDDDLL